MNCKYRKTTSSEAWFWKSVFTSAPLWWNVSVHKNPPKTIHPRCVWIQFHVVILQTKKQKQKKTTPKHKVLRNKTWSFCVQLSSVQWVTSVFPLIVRDGGFCPDVQVLDSTQASCRADAFVCRAEWLGVINKDTNTHNRIFTIHARTDQGIEIYSLVRRVLLWTQ